MKDERYKHNATDLAVLGKRTAPGILSITTAGAGGGVLTRATMEQAVADLHAYGNRRPVTELEDSLAERRAAALRRRMRRVK